MKTLLVLCALMPGANGPSCQQYPQPSVEECISEASKKAIGADPRKYGAVALSAGCIIMIDPDAKPDVEAKGS